MATNAARHAHHHPLVRRVGQAVIDVGAWVGGLVVATRVSDADLSGDTALGIVGVVVGAHLTFALALGLYQGRFWYGSTRELSRLYLAVAAAAASGCLLAAIVGVEDAILVVLLAAPLMIATGQVVRVVRYRLRHHRAAVAKPQARRLLVFGAGDGGEMALRALTASETSPFTPVAVLDDDPARRRLELHGVRVQGTRADIGQVARDTGADAMLVAIPSASGDTLTELTDIAHVAGLEVFVLPPVEEIFGVVGASDIRPVSQLDLLGRHPVEIDVASIADFVTDRRVLVTGAGGSIGSELCRQIHRFGAAALTMVDIDDSGLHGVQLSMEGRALLQSDELVLLDIRDRARVFEVMAAKRPDVVFHAAALKHLSLLERYPQEAWKTNVLGTQNLLDAALAHDVAHFVNISTDKAADPVCVLGWTKRITERQTAHAATTSGRHFVSVRFGNVLGSRGSVLEIFEAQLAAGGPLTVTDENVTRYFMTVPEAVRLTLNAAAIGRGGQVLVLDMGHPVRIADVARRLAEAAPRNVDIVYTGLRPGEKLHETLLATGEVDLRPHHPQITEVDVPPLDLSAHSVPVHLDGQAIAALASRPLMDDVPRP